MAAEIEDSLLVFLQLGWLKLSLADLDDMAFDRWDRLRRFADEVVQARKR